jgi:hypothetical protein
VPPRLRPHGQGQGQGQTRGRGPRARRGPPPPCQQRKIHVPVPEFSTVYVSEHPGRGSFLEFSVSGGMEDGIWKTKDWRTWSTWRWWHMGAEETKPPQCTYLDCYREPTPSSSPLLRSSARQNARLSDLLSIYRRLSNPNTPRWDIINKAAVLRKPVPPPDTVVNSQDNAHPPILQDARATVTHRRESCRIEGGRSALPPLWTSWGSRRVACLQWGFSAQVRCVHANAVPPTTKTVPT